jgi:hypothetical protein
LEDLQFKMQFKEKEILNLKEDIRLRDREISTWK